MHITSLLALNSTEIQRNLLPDESGPPFSRLAEEHTIPVNRNFHPGFPPRNGGQFYYRYPFKSY